MSRSFLLLVPSRWVGSAPWLRHSSQCQVPGLFQAGLETGCRAAGLRSCVPFLRAHWAWLVCAPVALVFDNIAEDKQPWKAKSAARCANSTGPDKLEVKRMIPGGSDGMAGGVGNS